MPAGRKKLLHPTYDPALKIESQHFEIVFHLNGNASVPDIQSRVVRMYMHMVGFLFVYQLINYLFVCLSTHVVDLYTSISIDLERYDVLGGIE